MLTDTRAKGRRANRYYDNSLLKGILAKITA